MKPENAAKLTVDQRNIIDGIVKAMVSGVAKGLNSGSKDGPKETVTVNGETYSTSARSRFGSSRRSVALKSSRGELAIKKQGLNKATDEARVHLQAMDAW